MCVCATFAIMQQASGDFRGDFLLRKLPMHERKCALIELCNVFAPEIINDVRYLRLPPPTYHTPLSFPASMH